MCDKLKISCENHFPDCKPLLYYFGKPITKMGFAHTQCQLDAID